MVLNCEFVAIKTFLYFFHRSPQSKSQEWQSATAVELANIEANQKKLMELASQTNEGVKAIYERQGILEGAISVLKDIMLPTHRTDWFKPASSVDELNKLCEHPMLVSLHNLSFFCSIQILCKQKWAISEPAILSHR